jgi:regulator of protease activity HflC (stomatin/prohibitin superfamily)
MGGEGILAIALIVVAFLAIAMSVRSVPQGMEYTVERFGRYT